MSTFGPKSHLSGGRVPIAQHQNFYGARSWRSVRRCGPNALYCLPGRSTRKRKRQARRYAALFRSSLRELKFPKFLKSVVRLGALTPRIQTDLRIAVLIGFEQDRRPTS